MKKLLIIFIGLNLILPINGFARVASDCNDYCSNLEEAGIEPPTGQVCICNPLKAEGFESIINNIIDFIFKIAIVLAPLMIVVGGFMFLTSSGDLQKVSQAKKLMIWAAVGFIIVLLAKGFMSMLESILGI